VGADRIRQVAVVVENRNALSRRAARPSLQPVDRKRRAAAGLLGKDRGPLSAALDRDQCVGSGLLDRSADPELARHAGLSDRQGARDRSLERTGCHHIGQRLSEQCTDALELLERPRCRAVHLPMGLRIRQPDGVGKPS
jgi:hypothetical protein